MEKLVQQINKNIRDHSGQKLTTNKKNRLAARLSTPRWPCEKQAFGAARPQACKPGPPIRVSIDPLHRSKAIRSHLAGAIKHSTISKASVFAEPMPATSCKQLETTQIFVHPLRYTKTNYMLSFRFMHTWQNINFETCNQNQNSGNALQVNTRKFQKTWQCPPKPRLGHSPH